MDCQNGSGRAKQAKNRYTFWPIVLHKAFRIIDIRSRSAVETCWHWTCI